MSIALFLLLSWVPLVSAVFSYAFDPALLSSDSATIIAHLLWGALGENIVVYPFIALLSIAAGTNIPLLIYFVRAYRPGIPLRGLPTSILGMMASIIGIGCAACGAFFFTAFSASISGILLALPFEGKWIGYLGIGLLFFSTWYLAKAMSNRSL